jgi:broad specificity phosphatase PhoE
VRVARIYLVRHGQDAGTWGVDRDPELSKLGREQAVTVAEKLCVLTPMAIVSSPLIRAQQTAAALAGHWGTTVQVVPAVAEIPAPAAWTDDRPGWLRRVTTGTWSEAGDEVMEWHRAIIEYLCALERDSVIFSHFVVINAAVGAAGGSEKMISFRPDNCSVTILENDTGALTLVEQGGEAATAVR